MVDALSFFDSQIRVPGLRIRLPVRSTLVRLNSGAVLISPGSQLTQSDYQGLGNVTAIVAPSLMHCGGVPVCSQAYPQAGIWGPPAARQRHPEIAWTHTLSESPWPYQAELAAHTLVGLPSLQETVFVHRASRTLIVADLAFNLMGVSGFGARLFYNLMGTYRRFAVSRLFMRAVRDRPAFTRSVQALLDDDFDRLVMSHGDVVPRQAKSLLRQALAERGVRC